MTSLRDGEGEGPKQKRLRTSKVSLCNDLYFEESQKRSIAAAYQAKTTVKNGITGAEVCSTPFRHVSLPNFIVDGEYIDHLISELTSPKNKMNEKNNDLYKFKQSVELKHVNSQYIKTFRNIVQEQMLPWIREVTCAPLNEKVDMFCSKYEYTDTLLCHDDELEERHIAFIYYLVPKTWSKEDGGTLDLFNSDEHGQPKDIVKSIIPRQNQFVFFEVTSASLHQVCEVLTEEKSRLAISGWFHGPAILRPSPYIEPPIPLKPCGGIEEEVFLEWINPIYLSPEIHADIKERFENESEIELNDFLKEDKYDELLAALKGSGMSWKQCGPPNKRFYDICAEEQLPGEARTILKLLQSDAMFLLLSTVTGIALHELATTSDDEGEEGTSSGNGSSSNSNPVSAKCRIEVQRWKHGNYTLLHDTDSQAEEVALDVVLYVGCSEWSLDYGGYTSYVAKGEDEELLSVCPTPNSLALVYRDSETLRFVKHINHKATKAKNPQYYCFSGVYYEK